MRQFKDFVNSELNELDSKDVDQLFDCIKDNLEEMGVKMNDAKNAELYSEIKQRLKESVGLIAKREYSQEN